MKSLIIWNLLLLICSSRFFPRYFLPLSIVWAAWATRASSVGIRWISRWFSKSTLIIICKQERNMSKKRILDACFSLQKWNRTVVCGKCSIVLTISVQVLRCRQHLRSFLWNKTSQRYQKWNEHKSNRSFPKYMRQHSNLPCDRGTGL
jgi:hypothetical protein